MENEELLKSIVMLAKEAGASILSVAGDVDALDVKKKEDESLLTVADIRAHEIIHDELQFLTPDIPVLSEEGDIPLPAVREKWHKYWCVDPLDGTRGFVHGSEEYTVNIALIEDHQPVLGVLYAPVPKICYYAVKGGKAMKQIADQAPQPVTTKARPHQGWRVVVGDFHGTKKMKIFMAEYHHADLIQINSSLKFGAVSEGYADIYPRFGETSEWDTAAGQCVLEAAGGVVVDFEGNPLQYNARHTLVNPEFLALGDVNEIESMLKIVKDIGERSEQEG